MRAARYAIYFAPDPISPLWRFGSRVVGYDAACRSDLPFLKPAHVDEARWRKLVESPRRYGFHATLKAPFEPVAQAHESDLVEALHAFARTQAPFTVPALALSIHHGYATLMPSAPCAALDAYAGAAVEAFEPFRAPLSPQDLSRRLASPLDEREKEHLNRWGYPYVFDRFRFHMTLAGPMPPLEAESVGQALAELFAQEVPAQPLVVDSVALYAEPERGGDFVIVERARFGGAA